jgi:hypothetical protein
LEPRSGYFQPVAFLCFISAGYLQVFALWKPDGFFYPGTVSAQLKRGYKVRFIDGSSTKADQVIASHNIPDASRIMAKPANSCVTFGPIVFLSV